MDNARTFSIISQRLNCALCEAMKVTYFPKYSPATSALWNLEPQIPNSEEHAPTIVDSISEPEMEVDANRGAKIGDLV
jgi:hypothetical protein